MAAVFTNLEDSPMFRKQVYSLEQMTDELRDRCQKLHKGCNKFMNSLDQAYEGDLVFADSLQAFGAGQDDPISVAIGGPVMSKFTTAFREIATYKELLRSQVEHMLGERVTQFINEDIQTVKDCRRRLDKSTYGYDQAREKVMAIRKGAKTEVITELEEDLHNAKSTFDKCRFNLVTALATIEAKKKYEFLESISAVMDAHFRYFKQGYELLSQLEPFIHQVLTYAQQSKEMVNDEQDRLAKKIQEFRTQSELSNTRSIKSMDTTSNGDGIHVIGVHSYKKIEALMQSAAKGEVQVLKQGYLLKRSSNLRGEWKRRFFVLDSQGTLYYYGNKSNKQLLGPPSQQSGNASEGSGVFSRFRFSHQRASSQGGNTLGYHTIDLRTSTIKIGADQNDMRFCFRLISPMKTYTLQAENGGDQAEWIEKITGVIASLLNLPFPRQLSSGNSDTCGRNIAASDALSKEENLQGYDNICQTLRNIPGNDICSECGSPDPDWASLNLGILLCIECSGVHRNLGVHVSKVRSLCLDVKVWEPVIMNLFHALGNTYCNSVWEALLRNQDARVEESDEAIPFIERPTADDSFAVKEKFIHSKYVDKTFVMKETDDATASIWETVKANDVRGTYRLLVTSDARPRYDDLCSELHHDLQTADKKQLDPASCEVMKGSGDPGACLQGCSLLHIACHHNDPMLAELLLLFGADISAQDFHGRTPLHHCVLKQNDELTKYMLKRGAKTTIKDGGGLTALERRMELGAITDEELFILFVG